MVEGSNPSVSVMIKGVTTEHGTKEHIVVSQNKGILPFTVTVACGIDHIEDTEDNTQFYAEDIENIEDIYPNRDFCNNCIRKIQSGKIVPETYTSKTYGTR